MDGLAGLEWVTQMHQEMSNSDSMRMRVVLWHESTPEIPWPKTAMPGVAMFRESADAKLQESLAISDAKSLYDGLRKEARGKEPRVALSV